VDSLAYVVTSGWASGVNVYATVLVTGLLGRVGGVDGVPDVLQRTDVLVFAAALWAVEFVADKIPYVDNAWDAVHTFVRPTIGAIIGALLAGEAQDLNEAFAAVIGGGTALASHAAKAGLRLAVNASPEPLSNIILSLLEDGAVVGVILFSVDHPYAALAIALALMAGAGILLVVLFRAIRRTVARFLGESAAPT
jgi:Domain of unknown function (DUF4126)